MQTLHVSVVYYTDFPEKVIAEARAYIITPLAILSENSSIALVTTVIFSTVLEDRSSLVEASAGMSTRKSQVYLTSVLSVSCKIYYQQLFAEKLASLMKTLT